MNFGKYRKAVVAIVGFAVTVATIYFGVDNSVLQAVIPLLTALGVYSVPNKSVD